MSEESHRRVPLTAVLCFVNLLKMELHCLNLQALLSDEFEHFSVRPSVIFVCVCELPCCALSLIFIF